MYADISSSTVRIKTIYRRSDNLVKNREKLRWRRTKFSSIEINLKKNREAEFENLSKNSQGKGGLSAHPVHKYLERPFSSRVLSYSTGAESAVIRRDISSRDIKRINVDCVTFHALRYDLNRKIPPLMIKHRHSASVTGECSRRAVTIVIFFSRINARAPVVVVYEL